MSRLVYILSASHSGSTLLAMLLGSHRDACSVGELKATSLGDASRYRCSCGALIRECPFWTGVAEAMASRGQPFSVTDARTDHGEGGSWYSHRLLKPLHRGPVLEGVRDSALALSPSWRRRFPRLQERNAALIESICELTGARILIDSSKTALRLKYLLKIPTLDVKVVRLIRDGRAVALTYMDPRGFANTRETRVLDNRHAHEMPMELAAYRWRRSNVEAENLLSRLDSSRWIEVRYEEYCTHPEATLAKMCTFLDLDPNAAIGEFRSTEHHVLGNSMRLDVSSQIELDDRWRTALSADELKTFDRIAGDLNRRYGYRSDG